MIQLQPNESVVMSVHKHWIVLGSTVFTLFILILIPLAAVAFFYIFPSVIFSAAYYSLVLFTFGLYLLILLIFFFILWTNYYLTLWVITNQRIIDIRQRGLFTREVAEIPLARVQDITVDINGFIQTFLKFGTIQIQTAGEREFEMRYIPKIYEVKDTILKLTRPFTREAQSENEGLAANSKNSI